VIYLRSLWQFADLLLSDLVRYLTAHIPDPPKPTPTVVVVDAATLADITADQLAAAIAAQWAATWDDDHLAREAFVAWLREVAL